MKTAWQESQKFLRRPSRGMALAAAASVAAGIVLVPTAAYAEGSWSSYISGALTGFYSRWWMDNNNDNFSTVVYFERCEDRNTAIEPDTVTVRVERYRTWPLPNENRGSKTIYCNTAGSGNWGDVPSGEYAFVIEKINGNTSGGRVDIPYVKVSY